ncbi:MAG: PD40 domain-containing protein [Pseudonocardiales bacterium]|nr:PD40 domain-containing protein [Pseudonocardiales bacterium]
MARVFISHASEDGEYAAELHEWLVGAGHEVFLDRALRDGIRVGEQWQQRLHERLRWADAVVCVVTRAYLASAWCAAEVGSALSRGSRVLPVQAEPGVSHPLLTSLQYAELTVDSPGGRARLLEELRRVDAAGGAGWPDDRSPFPGLRALDVTDHQVFFGRNAEVEQLAALLRSPVEHAEGAVLLVVGPSGCGKSSLVRAGLLHAMAAEPGWWTLAPMLPGADPVAALVRELAITAHQLVPGWSVAEVGHRVDDGGLTGLVDELLLAGRARRLLVVVDQFEELFTQSTPVARAHFVRLLHPALGGPVQVVATLRPEFLDPLLVDPDLAVLPTRPYPLRPLRREALAAVIQGPAHLAGIGVDEELVARLVGDTDSGEALPLLAFTLAQLAEGISRGGQLSPRRYDQLGGVQGALTRQAEAALAEASAASGRGRAEILAGLLRLVTVDEQGRPTRWRVPRDELPEIVLRELDAFVRRRLLTTDSDQGRVVIGVAHEAFLSAWAPLAQAIEANASALRARRAVEQAATEWDKEKRSPARLWEHGQLAAAVADTGARIQAGDLVTDRVELSPTAHLFLRSSIRRDRIRRRGAITVLSVLLVLAVVAAGIAVIQQRAAAHQRDLAVSRQVAGQALQLRATHPGLAAQLALAAYHLAPTTQARGSLLSISATPYATRLTAHTSTVHSVAFSPDGRTLATGSLDRTARLWDIRDPDHPTLLSTLTGHTNWVNSVAFSPDGHTVATGSADDTARLWDVRNPRQPAPLGVLTGHTGSVRSVAFSPDGHTLATSSDDRTARLWDVRDPHQPAPLGALTGHTGSVWSVAFSPDGRTLATASLDQTARLWDIGDPHQPAPLGVLTGHTSAVYSVAFSPDGRTLATASLDDTARLWDIRNPRQPALLGTLTAHTSAVCSVAFSPDGRTLATASADDTARLWDIRNPRQPASLGVLTGHTSAVYSVAFSPDGRTLATASNDHTARLWDLPGPIVAGHTNIVFSVAFSPDGRTLATASLDDTARLWDIRNPRQPAPLSVLTGHTNVVYSVAFSPDGHTLATASHDRTARLWDIRDPRQPTLLSTLTGHTNWVNSVAFSPDGRTLATSSDDQTARLWDIRDPHQPTPLATLTGPTSAVLSVAFSPDGHTLATASADRTARLWDIRNPRQPALLGTLTGHTSAVYSVAFSPDGHTLATASDDHTARLWDIRDPRQPAPLGTLTGHTNTVYSVAFSPDGRTLATASADDTARLWDIRNPRQPAPLGTLTGHTNSVWSVAFSPDGHTLPTASDDHTARLWETSLDNVVARICRITPTITRSEWDQYLPGLTYRPPCS